MIDIVNKLTKHIKTSTALSQIRAQSSFKLFPSALKMIF